MGLALAFKLSKRRTVIDFDTNEERIVELKAGRNSISEAKGKTLHDVVYFLLTTDLATSFSANCHD